MTAIEGFNRSLAILVAIDRYGDGVPELQTPVADAEELAHVLSRDHGFETEIWANEKATLAGLRALLAALKARVGSEDRVLFYFAGHGIAMDGDGGPEGFVLPQDSTRSSTDRYLPMVELHSTLSALTCRHMLVVLDCCFAGAFRWAGFRHLVLAPENLHRERYEWFTQDAAWQAIASAAHNQKALDVASEQPLGKRGDDRKHSPFASALIRGLKGAADQAAAGDAGDGVITATELYLFLEKELLPTTKDGPRQTPILWPLRKHERGQFVFLVPGMTLALPSGPTLDADANPWRGLRPYEARHAELFFGRGAVTKKLVGHVAGNALTIVTGPSGSGKSSLVRAGLVPRMAERGSHAIVVRPGPTPFANLARALNERLALTEAISEAALRSDPPRLTAELQDRLHSGHLLLVIDQAEELITMNRNERVMKDYLTLIARLLSQKAPTLRIVFTIRSDFEPQFAQSSLGKQWTAARFLIPPMTQDELRRVIEGPAAVKVMRFEHEGLVDHLVNEVIQMPGALPLLSFALSEMYAHYLKRHGDDRCIASVDYDALQGGVTGSLRVRANEVVDGVSDAHRLTARRVLERLVSVESGEYARRRAPRRELTSHDAAERSRIEEVLLRLDEARLIVFDDVDGEAYLELAHDALIFGWDRLRTWVRQDALKVAALRRLTRDAVEWARSPKESAGLLWSDAARLRVVQELQSEASPGLNAEEFAFAQASAKRARRNRVVRGVTVTALAVLAVGASAFAYISETQRTRSESIRLSLTSQQAAAVDQSLLLAAAAMRLEENFEAHAALFAAFSKRPLLQRMFYGANGTIKHIHVLPNDRILALSEADSGILLTWDNDGKSPARPVTGIAKGVDDYVLLLDAKKLSLLRGEILEVYDFDAPFEVARLRAKVNVGNVKLVAAESTSSVLYLLSPEGMLTSIDVVSGKQADEGRAPGKDFDGRLVAFKGSPIAYQSEEGIWMNIEGTWKEVAGSAPEGRTYISLTFDSENQQVVSGLGLDNSTSKMQEGSIGFRCWKVPTALPSDTCPTLGPIGTPAKMGFVGANSAFYSGRDAQSGFDTTEYRMRVRDKWAQLVLRTSPTYVTALAMHPGGATLYVGTIDGELSEYSLDRFLAFPSHTHRDVDETLAVNWDESLCYVSVLAGGELRNLPCSSPTAATSGVSVKIGSIDNGAPDLTPDETGFRTIDIEKRLSIWDRQLNRIAQVDPPSGLNFSALDSVTYDGLGGRLFVVFDKSSAIWSFSIERAQWNLLVRAPFEVRTLSMARDGRTVLAGAKSSGEIISVNAETGDIAFRANLPSGQWVQRITSGERFILATAFVGQHGLFMLDPRTGDLLSGNLNRFSGPVRVLAISPDGRYFAVEGVGYPADRRPQGTEVSSGLGIELWDARRLLPLGDGVRMYSYERSRAAFSPSGRELLLALPSPPRIVVVPLEPAVWSQRACATAARNLSPEERARFGVPFDEVCSR